MFQEKLTAQELADVGIIAIIRADSDEGLMDAAAALHRGGVTAMEITLNTPHALKVMSQVKGEWGDKIRVGAGTILGPDDARRSIEAGAEFIVTPSLQPDTIGVCREQRVPILCGCMTPGEALIAHRAGADFIKLFPAGSLGVDYVRSILAPLPFLKLMPTGGVSLENLAAFIRAGCAGAAVGGELVSKKILREKDWDRLAALAEKFRAALTEARTQ
ncbi:MAG: bifunctional 4-hydroxy-2-oxoglutarate aldolase/2-dehydro-3-deoxy-phosphogluconate aldolase [Armatimonadota bacterium]|nr:bifunctional 4-hydroxy-2-oxoglutarate aldolase/2-dehydro-3-deoxy-phosphogluconate aldolase [Armatimonadota bacterium]